MRFAVEATTFLREANIENRLAGVDVEQSQSKRNTRSCSEEQVRDPCTWG